MKGDSEAFELVLEQLDIDKVVCTSVSTSPIEIRRSIDGVSIEGYETEVAFQTPCGYIDITYESSGMPEWYQELMELTHP